VKHDNQHREDLILLHPTNKIEHDIYKLYNSTIEEDEIMFEQEQDLQQFHYLNIKQKTNKESLKNNNNY